MARPTYRSGESTAREKIIEAFWEALEEIPYTSMSARELCRRANVNKNTFYYHFERIDDLASEAIDEALLKEFGQLLIGDSNVAEASISTLMASPKIAQRFSHITTVLSKNATALQPVVIEQIIESWCSILGFSELDPFQERFMSFVANGLVGALRDASIEEIPLILAELMKSNTAQACIAEITSWGSRS